MRLTHVRLLVDDFETSVAFYRDVAGFEILLEAGGFYTELDAGGVRLGIYRRSMMADVVGDPGARGAGAADRVLLALRVDDVDAAQREMQERGATFVTDAHDQKAWEIRVAHLRDPDGNLIELNAPL